MTLHRAEQQDRSQALRGGGGLDEFQRHVATRSLKQLAWQRFSRNRMALVGMIVLGIMFGVAAVGPLVIDRDAAYRPNPAQMNQTPSLAHPMGTDEVGRDIFARVVYASRISLSIGLLAAVISVGIGTLVGALSGYYGGWIDTSLMRFTDMLLAIPTIFLLIVLTVFFGPSVPAIIIVLGILSWMRLARIVRANFLSLREKEFVEAARSIGANDRLLIFRHILPNTIAPITVAATLTVGIAMLIEAAVSYLGLGVQPPTPSWGNMLYNAQSQIWVAPWISIFPGVMILVTVLNINFVGDGLRAALDPRMNL
jgi:peptide/nickel transport system permease protein